MEGHHLLPGVAAANGRNWKQQWTAVHTVGGSCCPQHMPLSPARLRMSSCIGFLSVFQERAHACCRLDTSLSNQPRGLLWPAAPLIPHLSPLLLRLLMPLPRTSGANITGDQHSPYTAAVPSTGSNRIPSAQGFLALNATDTIACRSAPFSSNKLAAPAAAVSQRVYCSIRNLRAQEPQVAHPHSHSSCCRGCCCALCWQLLNL